MCAQSDDGESKSIFNCMCGVTHASLHATLQHLLRQQAQRNGVLPMHHLGGLDSTPLYRI